MYAELVKNGYTTTAFWESFHSDTSLYSSSPSSLIPRYTAPQYSIQSTFCIEFTSPKTWKNEVWTYSRFFCLISGKSGEKTTSYGSTSSWISRMIIPCSISHSSPDRNAESGISPLAHHPALFLIQLGIDDSGYFASSAE